QALIVSGCEPRSRQVSWYTRVRAAVLSASGAEDQPDAPAMHGADLGEAWDAEAGLRKSNAGRKAAREGPQTPASASAQLAIDFGAAGGEPDIAPTGRRRETIAARAERYGVAFHTLMQHAAETGTPDA